MVHIKINKGLDIPISGKPSGYAKDLVPGGEATKLTAPNQISLDLKPFEDTKFRLLVKAGDVVKLGQPLAEDKATPGRMFASPAAGTIVEIRRGLKRVLQEIIIETSKQEEIHEFPTINPQDASPQQITERLLAGGLFAHIRSRPFNLLADPHKTPRNIFVKALESAPFVPPAEMQVAGFEKEFQAGLDALSKLTTGKVHLVFRKDTVCNAFFEAERVQKHTAEGPHPISNHSLHIQYIDPIKSPDDANWVLNVLDVIGIGHILTKGSYFVQRVISVAGPGILPDRVGYFKGRMGMPVRVFVAGRLEKGLVRLISGDPLMGNKVSAEDFLGFHDTVFCAIPENVTREFLHFMKLGLSKYTFSKAYLSGHFDNSKRDYYFNTNQHGEHRAFIDSTLYDEVMPLRVPTMLLVKAVMAEDYELANSYGLIEVDSEDFALPAFVCMSKIEMPEIIKSGLKNYAKEVLA